MLINLYIQNYAIIRELKVEFSSGLTTLTGETGAGKSILLGALSLILGQRADTSVLLDKSRKCVIEGMFKTNVNLLARIFEENDLDIEEELIIRREIAPSGKSRAFVNDTPVNQMVLKDIGLLLIDIHSQHENLNLSQHKYQLQVIDVFGESVKYVEEYKAQYQEYKSILDSYINLLAEKDANLSQLDYVRFQYNELEKAKIVEGELVNTEEELNILQHSEDIKTAFYDVYDQLSGAELNVLTLLKEAQTAISKITKIYSPAVELSERIESVIIELKDIATETDHHMEKIDHDPEKLKFLEDRLNLLNTLLQKHNVRTESELIEKRNFFHDNINRLENMEFQLEDIKKDLATREKILIEKSGLISIKRRESADNFKSEIQKLLAELGMPGARFDVRIDKLDQLTDTGVDRVFFLFTANKNTTLQELSKVASGGELSRLMLSIKSVTSHSLGLPTIIFDEIDTGVSGEIAHRIGILMKKMSSDRQVLSVTHLPQVAACGRHHYFVFKEDNDEGTMTKMRKLESEDRVVEIAKMLSGEATTPAAIENARVLLNS